MLLLLLEQVIGDTQLFILTHETHCVSRLILHIDAIYDVEAQLEHLEQDIAPYVFVNVLGGQVLQLV